jgi:quinol monooxygenase YgiN
MVLRTLLFTIIFITLGELSHAQDNAIYVATYVDVLPSEGGGATMLKRYRDASRNEDGNLRFDVLHEIARSDHFAILEVWRDKVTFERHNSAVSSLHFRESFNSIRSAPAYQQGYLRRAADED